MRNTLALGVIILGTLLLVSAIKGWTMMTTIQVMVGTKPWDTPSEAPKSGTIPGRATASQKDRPGYADDQLEKNPDGSWKRDGDGNIILKPGATPFDPQQAGITGPTAQKNNTPKTYQKPADNTMAAF